MSQNKLSEAVVLRVIQLLTSVNLPKYKHVRPANSQPDKYIVVNAFCTVPGKMQKFVLNVNVHTKNITGNPDIASLQTYSQSVLNILEEYESADMLIDYETQESVIPEPQFDEHYTNLRFSLRMINN